MFENGVLRRIFERKRNEVTGGWKKLHTEQFHTFYFADDQAKIPDNENTIQRALRELNKIILGYNFEISIQKTKKKWHFVVNGQQDRH
jgi:hypothetical protein